MTVSELQSAITSALKAHDSVRVETLRFLLSAVRNEAIAKYGAEAEGKITSDDILAAVKKQVKTHKESVEAFTKAGRNELAATEEAQLAILKEFLPAELTDDALKTLLAPIIESGEKNFGKIMGSAMAAVKGQADGARISALLREMMK